MSVESALPEGVYVVGLGTRAVAQITLESHQIIAGLDCAVFLDGRGEVQAYLAELGVEACDVSSIYAEEDARIEVYRAIADVVVEQARRFGRVGYLAPGNPNFLNVVVEILEARCAEEGIPFHLLPGVSSLDTVITDLRLPVGDVGMQCFDTTTFARLDPQIDPRIPLLLFEPGVYGESRIRYRRTPRRETVRKLRDLLLERYAPSQRWILVSSSPSTSTATHLVWGTLDRLDEFSDALGMGTLVIPGAWWPEGLADAAPEPDAAAA